VVVSAFDAALEEIERAPSGPDVGAFFDFDGTLIDGYSAGALYSHRVRNRELGLVELLHTMRAMSGGTMAEAEFLSLVNRGFASWGGRPVEELEALGEELLSKQIAGDVFHETWRLVKAHQRRRHTVAIATSATRFQVAPLARELGVKQVLCTELEETAGILTGRVKGRTLWGAGKIAAVRAFAKREGVDLTRSYAYANGDEDVPFLTAVGRPYAVNPQPILAEAAERGGWPVLRTKVRPRRLDPKPVVRTAAIYGSLIGAGAAGIALGTLSGDKRKGVDLATSIFSQVAGVLSDVHVEVIGEANLWKHRPAVFVINHQSSLIDLIVTTSLLRGGATAVAKAEAAKIPVIGQLLTMADFAFIDRTDSGQAQEALGQALRRLETGVSIVISPEGTRSLTPRVGAFKKGGFHLAMQAGVPVVPIVIRNAGELMWRNARTARPGIVQVRVHQPIPTTGWTKADLDIAVEKVHRLYVETLDSWPGPDDEDTM
jgi:putative phosphoserine phosphatase/1-acylglycerol-3-phosphate O-acyltransferase